ncbi:hypothetical protein [Chryseobacterium pennipullorum]|uniref:Uncharacterized protein n=1 Tax=Chryseobacterium pennipullorum TaxID=2258963 RepID=A0A3D9AXT3_9FLAO|nr:hypothetical protein [Chryseobacterium pennipullorum]REC46153.1 hypothetical protein DRF67_15480 [Chryseobacterium pennipullorum]
MNIKTVLLHLVVFLLVAQTHLYAQKIAQKDNFTFQVQKEVGDLNNDKLDDKIMVEMDLKDDTRPLRVQIFLSQPDKKLKLVVSSTKLIESQYPSYKKGEHNGDVIPDFFIEEGKLKMLTDIKNRKSSYEFRLKQNNFELIKISRVRWDGKDTTFETKIDLLAKTKIEFEQVTGSEKLLNKRTKTIKINSLPKIQDLSYSDLEQY